MSTERLEIDDLQELIAETNSLYEDYQTWTSQFPESPAKFSPLNPPWRYAPEKPSPDVVALRLWLNRLYAYLANLRSYFVDVLEQPERVRRFPLVDLIQGNGLKQLHTSRGELCLAYLDEHRRLLPIERERQRARWHAELRELLHEAIGAAKTNVFGAASEMRIDRSTLEDYLNAKTDIQVETLNKMRSFIVKHCPSAKEKIRRLLMTKADRRARTKLT